MTPQAVYQMDVSLADTTGRLDRVISEMKVHAKRVSEGDKRYDDADAQTLEHHAEDMIAMGQYIIAHITRG